MSKTINAITVAALTAVQAAIVNQARSAAPGKRDAGADQRKQIKREVFSVVKAKFGIDPSVKVMAVTANASAPDYLVLHVAGKRNPNRGMAFRLGADGKWDGTYVTKDQLFPPPAPVQQPATGDDLSDGYQNNGGGQSAGAFQGVDAPAAAGSGLPDGVKLVSVSDRTVILEFSDDWNYDVCGDNGDRIVLTKD